MQQDICGERQLQPPVLWAWLQRLRGEGGGAVPLQVPLVLLRALQEVPAHGGEIRLQVTVAGPEPALRLAVAYQAHLAPAAHNYFFLIPPYSKII